MAKGLIILSYPEIKNEDIDVAELMHKIRDRVRKRRGIDSSAVGIAQINSSSSEAQSLEDEIRSDLDYINSNQNIHNENYIISSHRRIIGKFLVEGRRLVNGEVHRYVDSVISKQIELNSSSARILNRLVARIDKNTLSNIEIKNNLSRIREDIGQDISRQQHEIRAELDGQLGQVRSEFRDEISRQQHEIRAELDGQLGQVRFEFRDEISRQQHEIRAELDGQLGQVRSEFRDEISRQQQEIRAELDGQLGQVRSEFREELNRILNMLDSKDSSLSAWSKFYNNEITEDLLTLNIDYHERFISLIKEIAQKAANGMVPKLLEVGVGTATMSIYFSRYSFEVVGLDNDPNVVRNAIKVNKDLGGYAKFILMDAFDLNMFKGDYFDVAFSQGTMEHFNDAEIIEMISKQLEAAKFVIFSVPSIYYPHKEFGNERKMSKEDWEMILKKGDFNIIGLDYYKDSQHIVCVIGS
ncbi:methyltransferase domain-containing protein [Methanothrix harundinacea]|uniref:Methyltransferase domain-containing protein n=1 Tax=Methanothrix harundinacea (strain 6Ac) TaxID=1110509 RepID=G7WMH8_METH6|nr:methyltransferase domain-containing protein [Methanothrix harundinacea]AET64473.1 hypothetical protein Mhar_1105 [Methanothrix harundinacea 6Ac]